MRQEIDYLKNRIIISAKRTRDNKFIVFYLDDGQAVTWEAEGDCCSQSWFEHIDVFGSYPLVVTEVQEIEMGELKFPKDDPEALDHSGYIQVYGFNIKTNMGYILIEMRNESNGYYGGYVSSFLGEPPGYYTDLCKLVDIL